MQKFVPFVGAMFISHSRRHNRGDVDLNGFRLYDSSGITIIYYRDRVVKCRHTSTTTNIHLPISIHFFVICLGILSAEQQKKKRIAMQFVCKRGVLLRCILSLFLFSIFRAPFVHFTMLANEWMDGLYNVLWLSSVFVWACMSGFLCFVYLGLKTLIFD